MPHLNECIADGDSSRNTAVFNPADWGAKIPLLSSNELQSLLDGLSMLDGRIRALLGRDGTYHAGSSGMGDLFKLETCLYLDQGIVRVSQADYTDGFKDLLDARAPEVRTLALPCWKIDGHLLLRATAVCDTVVIVSLQRATEMIEPELADLEKVFHLTKTEAAIVYDLFLGWTPQKIAADHDNSIHTIRAHIRRCYDKLGITCREELWRKLNAYRLA